MKANREDILKSCGYDPKYCQDYMVVPDDEIQDWIDDWNASGETITADQVKENKIPDMHYIRYDEDDYYLIVEVN